MWMGIFDTRYHYVHVNVTVIYNNDMFRVIFINIHILIISIVRNEKRFVVTILLKYDHFLLKISNYRGRE